MRGRPTGIAPAAGSRPEHARTVASYFGAFAPVPAWDELVRWPPDAFALANLVLDHSEGYRFAVAPPAGRHWPPFAGWADAVYAAGRAWAEAAAEAAEPPALVREAWGAVSRRRDVPLDAIRSGEAWDVAAALLTMHALADEACARVASPPAPGAPETFESVAWALLQSHGSLSRLSPERVRIVPKTHFSTRGITIRSLSRHLALCYEPIDVRWERIERPAPAAGPRTYEIVLVPWPLAVGANDFRPASAELLENMDAGVFGFFEFAPEGTLDCGFVDGLLWSARARSGSVDAVVLPEAAVTAAELPALEEVLARHGATFLVAGVREPALGPAFGRNYLHFGVRTDEGWTRHEQDKHHRWCLDEGQIRQYHLSRALDSRRLWWEAIDIRERALNVVDVGGGVTVAPLVCEDLARLDEVADLLRRFGPSLVVAVLLDGPQLASRWPCRYSSVLADDPGSAVLTLTSAGMTARSRPPGRPRSRVVAHWNGRVCGLRELELAPRASALLLSTVVQGTTLWTADGRRHDDVPTLTLAGVQQLRPARAAG